MLGDHPVELDVPRIGRHRGTLLEGVPKADQTCRSGRTCKGAVVVAATSPHPPAGIVPGQQGHEGDRLHEVARLYVFAERLGNAVRARPEVDPAPMLGEAHDLPRKAGKIDSFAGAKRRLDQKGGRHLVINGRVGDDAFRGTERRDGRDVLGHGAIRRSEVDNGEHPPSAAHLLPDCLFRAVHPSSASDGDGRRWSVVRLRDRTALHGSSMRKHHLPVSFDHPRRFLCDFNLWFARLKPESL